ncbi:MAG: baeRF7 domain-containing protein [Thermodesulfobacteriota bacterium]
MKLLSKEEFKKLTEKPGGWCVSIYMPTHRASPETKQDPIRFKNLIREAEERLKAGGLRSPDAKKLLKSGKALIKDGLFWQHQADGLATFISSDLFYHYRLPLKFDELVVVTDRFHIKPLLPIFSHENRFYILALSQNEIRFFQCTRYSVTEIKVENVPRSLSEALQYDEPEKQLQFHTRAPAAGGERAAMFHGHGVGKEDAKDNVLRFFQQLDQGLYALLGKENAPLVLAGVDYLFPIYREANRYPHLMENGIVGNPEGLKGEKLHEQAWRIVEPHFLKAQEDAFSRYRQFAGNERASNSIKKIVPAAYDGRIDILFVALGVQQWGIFDPDKHVVHFHLDAEPGDEDLLDLAAIHTYLNGGTVYPLKPEEMPDETPLAALFRY